MNFNTPPFIPLKTLLLLTLAACSLDGFSNETLTFRKVLDTRESLPGKKMEKTESPLLGQSVPLETPILIGKGSRIEVGNTNFIARAGGLSQFQAQPDGGIALQKGALLFHPLSTDFKINLSTQKCLFSIDSPGCFILEATSNGACKIISLSDTTTVLLAGGKKQTLKPGNLLFLLPEKQEFGPKVDIDLHTLFSTSVLVNGFEQPLEKIKALRLSAFHQNFRIKGRSNALIGDAKTESNYDVIFVK